MARGLGARRSNELYGGLLGDYLSQLGGLLAQRGGEVLSGEALDQYIQELFPGFGAYQIVDGQITFPEARAPQGGSQGLLGEMLPGGGVAGTIAGVGAKTADRGLLAIAEEAEQRGLPRERIFDATGWFRGADGKWRFEIDDSGLEWSPFVNKHTIKNPLYLNQAVKHPALFDAYPQIGGSPIIADVSSSNLSGVWRGTGSVGGRDGVGLSKMVDPKADVSELVDTLRKNGLTPDTARLQREMDGRSVTGHEIQHGIQEEEGFARGGSPSEFYVQPSQLGALRRLKEDAETGAEIANKLTGRGFTDFSQEEFNDALEQVAKEMGMTSDDAAYYLLTVTGSSPKIPDAKKITDTIRQYQADYDEMLVESVTNEKARDQYLRQAGEVEARNVQKRMGLLADDRRMLPPWMTEDVPRDQQIIQFE